jgi:hypothetical protein
MKILESNSTEDYHRTCNSLCAQAFTSLIGGEARLAVLLLNGKFKFIWAVIRNGRRYLYTYPRGNSLAKFSSEPNRLFFAQVFVKWISRTLIGPETLQQRSRSLKLQARSGHRFPQSKGWRYTTQRKRKHTEPASPVNSRNHIVVTRDGDSVLMRPYDFSEMTDENYEECRNDLEKETKRIAKARKLMSLGVKCKQLELSDDSNISD